MAKEYTELQLKARDAGITSWHTKSEDTLMQELGLMDAPKITEAPADEPANEIPKDDPSEEEAPADDGKVTFYWKEGRNQRFLITVKEATAQTPKQTVAISSTKSVLVLDSKDPVEAKAIARLRKMPRYKMDFDEVSSRKANVSDKGSRIDELMALDQKTLAQMAGGTVQDFRKTKGELIAELTA